MAETDGPVAAFMEAACVPLDAGHASGTLDQAESIRAARPDVASTWVLDLGIRSKRHSHRKNRRRSEHDEKTWSVAVAGGQREIKSPRLCRSGQAPVANSILVEIQNVLSVALNKFDENGVITLPGVDAFFDQFRDKVRHSAAMQLAGR